MVVNRMGRGRVRGDVDDEADGRFVAAQVQVRAVVVFGNATFKVLHCHRK